MQHNCIHWKSNKRKITCKPVLLQTRMQRKNRFGFLNSDCVVHLKIDQHRCLLSSTSKSFSGTWWDQRRVNRNIPAISASPHDTATHGLVSRRLRPSSLLDQQLYCGTTAPSHLGRQSFVVAVNNTLIHSSVTLYIDHSNICRNVTRRYDFNWKQY